MRNDSGARVDRRCFLEFGVMAVVLNAVGCDGGGEPGKPTGPPMENGNRNRLDKRIELGTKAAQKTKGKTKSK
jgi:hypothetical protein